MPSIWCFRSPGRSACRGSSIEEASMAQSPRSVGRRLVGRIGRSRLAIFLAILGPGLISAAADNDAGGITTWSVIGARYGYSLLWLLLLITPILAVTQEMGCLLYTSDAADDLLCVDLGGRRIIKKKKQHKKSTKQ